jgi:hypothetical protein
MSPPVTTPALPAASCSARRGEPVPANLVSPQATLDALIPGFDYFASWYVLGALAFWLIAMETRGRTIDDIDSALSKPAPVA